MLENILDFNYFLFYHRTAKRSSKKENLLVNPGFEDPITHGTWNCLGELNHGTGGIMIRTSKYTRTGKFAGVCHSRVGSWAGPGQFVGELMRLPWSIFNTLTTFIDYFAAFFIW